MTDKNLVVQHNKIIEARYRLSVGEQRLIKYLVSMIEPTDEDFKVYRIPVISLVKLLGVSDNDFYRKVKVWSKNLLSNVLIFKGENNRELQVTWLSSAEYMPDEGCVELEFSPKLKPFLLQLKKHFTAYELVNIISLKRIYSIRLYELLKQYQKIGSRKFKLDELRKILMLDDGEYKGFKDFKRWVLLPAQKELIEKTDISFTWSEEKDWRSVIAIEFFIKNQKRPDNGVENNKSLEEEKQVEEIPPNKVVEDLIRLGTTKLVAERIAKDYDESRIKAAIDYTEAQQKERKIKNPAGFLIEAIKNEYRDNKAEEKLRQDKEKKAREAKERQDKKMKEDEELQRKQKERAIEDYLAALTPEQLEALESEFIEAYKNDAIVVQKYSKTRLNSPLVKGCFDNYISKNKII
jgi:plasmid replication initiation protein